MTYTDKVLDHFSNPRNVGPIPAADGVGIAGEPACGDVFKAWIRVRGGRIEKAAFQVMGCAAAIATGSMMTVLAEGKTPQEALNLTGGEIVATLDGLPEPKLHCSNSAAEALHAAVDDYLYQAADAGGIQVSAVLDKVRQKLKHLCLERRLLAHPISVTARTLTPEQLLGDPDHDDYPVMKGRERAIEAEFLGAKGHAFTDRPGAFSGTLADMLDAPLENSYRRAVLVAAANAVARHMGLAQRTVHCKDLDLTECAKEVASFMDRQFHNPSKVFLVGLQPRLLEALAKRFEVRVTDLDAENVGQEKASLVVEPAEAALQCIEWCDVILATGSTLANGTADALIDSGKPIAFYGVTCAAATALLGGKRFCPLGH